MAAVRRWLAVLACALGVVAAGCKALPPMPPVDFSRPGWDIRQGQALWKPSQGVPELAGDLLIATQGPDSAIVEFSKTPIPLVLAQRSAMRWQVEFPTQNKRYAGRGQPPARLVFLWLPAWLAGGSPPKGWTSVAVETNHWRLARSQSGESLEIYLGR